MFAYASPTSLEEEQSSTKVLSLPIDSIRPNPSQPRRIFESTSLDELSASIVQYGLMQPISVRWAGDAFELVAGERRWRACKMAGLTHIDAIEVVVDSVQSACMALIENLQRTDLHFFEEAESYTLLIRRYNITQEELAARIGKKQSTIANKLRVNRLPIPVKEAVLCGGLTERHARAVLKLQDEALELALIQKAIEKSLSVVELERLVEATIENKTVRKPNITRLMHDYRIFVNTIKVAVRDIRKAGVDAGFTVEEREDDVLMTVTLPRRANKHA